MESTFNRERVEKAAKELGLKIKFDSSSPGVRFTDETIILWGDLTSEQTAERGEAMTLQQTLDRANFLHARIQNAKQKGVSYFYPETLFRKEVKELKELRSRYKNITGDWLVFG